MTFPEPSAAGRRAQLAELLRRRTESDPNGRPLSYPQQRLWFLDQLQPGSAVYNVPLGYDITGPLDHAALERAFTEVVRRHESLRSTFRAVAGTPRQFVMDPGPVTIPVLDLEGAGAAAEQLAAEAALEPFDLVNGPVLRANLLRFDDRRHRLLVTVHHIACDAWSVGVLCRELGDFYRQVRDGQPLSSTDLQVQYPEYAEWQIRSLRGSRLEESLGYWRQRLTGVTARQLPTDRPRPPVQGYQGAAVEFPLPDDVTRRVDELSRGEGVSAFTVLLSGFAVLLDNHMNDPGSDSEVDTDGRRDVVIGTPVAARTRPELHDLIGFFTNTLVLRCELGGQPSFRSLVRRTWQEVSGALAHQELPFEKLVEELHPDRDLARNPLFQVLFSYREDGSAGLELDSCQVRPAPGDTGTAKFDLTLSLARDAAGLSARFEYNTDLFDQPTVARLAARYVTVLDAALAAPDQRAEDLPTMPDAEIATLAGWQAGEDRPVPDTPVHELVARQAAASPDAVAVVADDATLTYRELDERAERLARRLRRAGAAGGQPVGIMLRRSSWLLVGLLGILKSGAAYLPLDPDYPPDRLAFMVRDSGARVVVTGDQLAAAAARLGADRLVTLPGDTRADDTPPGDIAGEPGEAGEPTFDPPPVRPEDLAYVIYTSGSTGRPKGVMVTHRNVGNLLVGLDGLLGDDPAGAWLAVTSVSFDISVVELLWTLTRGYRVVLHGDAPATTAQRLPDPVLAARTRPVDFSLFYFGSDSMSGSRYRLLLEGARFADRNGFAAVWTPERHFHRFGGLYPNPSVTGAAVAAVTERVAVRAGSVVLPLHDPLRVAEEWAAVDNISGGRVGISFASGWHANDFALAPDRYQERKRVMLRGVEEVRRLWRGQAVTRRNGVGGDIEVSVFPRPVQPELPIWLTSARHPETFRMAGDIGAGLLTHMLGHSIEELSEKIAIYRRAWREQGHGPGDGHVTVMLHTFVGPDLEQVRELVREPLSDYLATSFDLIASLGQSLGSAAEFRDLPPEDLRELVNQAFDRFFDTAGLLGDPQTCADMVDRLKHAGVDEVACLVDFGVPEDAALQALEHLGTVRDLTAQRRQAALSGEASVAEQLLRHDISHLQCTPSQARMLVEDDTAREGLRRLRRMLVGGEALPPDLAESLPGLVGGPVHNMYGPTEASVWATTSPVRVDTGAVTIGRPLANVRAHVVDRSCRATPIGVPGELMLGGPGVAAGYLGRPELTAERFVIDPGAGRPARAYRTGDLARWRSDGELEFLGRLDDQVKLHGHRIELGEIEAALAAHPGVRAAVVTVRGTGAEQRLVAYHLPDPTTQPDGGPPPDLLRGFLTERLPGYMVPAHFQPMDAFPLTPNGKVDRRALPDPATPAHDAPLPYTPPGSDLERLVAGVWQAVLKRDRIGVEDNFFELGGNSLLVVRVRAQLLERTPAQLSLVDMFRYPTVRTLASALTGGDPARTTARDAAEDRAARRRAGMARRAATRRDGGER